MSGNVKWVPMGMTGGWEMVGDKPVIGPEYFTTFDMDVEKEDDIYRMWLSWRPVRLIAHTYSTDGINWEMPRAVLAAKEGSAWEGDEVNRPTIVKKDGKYHMWYTGQMFAAENQMSRSCIGYAVSDNGIDWERREEPVIVPDVPWEKYCTMCPHVNWDEQDQIYKMWYSAGRMQESDAIGYATSRDGITWEKHALNPIFTADENIFWEMTKVEACFVLKEEDYYYMFYLGMDGDAKAYAGLARSKDGITGWERHPDNPIIAGTDGMWNFAGVCKVAVIKEQDGYKLWYNGCNSYGEHVGFAVHKGHNLFPDDMENYIPERGVCNYKGQYNYYYNRFSMLQEMLEDDGKKE